MRSVFIRNFHGWLVQQIISFQMDLALNLWFWHLEDAAAFRLNTENSHSLSMLLVGSCFISSAWGRCSWLACAISAVSPKSYSLPLCRKSALAVCVHLFSKRRDSVLLLGFRSEYAYIQQKTLSMCPFYHQLDRHRAVKKPLKGLVVMRSLQSLVKAN